MSGSPLPAPPRAGARRASHWVWVCLLVALVGGGVWYWWTYPDRLTAAAEQQLADDPTAAERLAEQAVDATGGRHARGWLVRARAFLKLGKPIEAAGCFGLISRPEAADQNALLELAEDAQASGQTLLADLALTAAAKGRAETVRVQRALLQIRRGRLPTTEVERLLTELEKIGNQDADTWIVIAETRQSRGELALALNAYRTALTRPQGKVPTAHLRRQLAQLLIDLGEYLEARPLIAKNLDHQEVSADDYVAQATLYRVDSQKQQALAMLGRALAAQPKHLPARLLMAAVLWESGHKDEAVADLRQAINENPSHPEAHYRLALALQQMGQGEEAKQHFAEQARLAKAQRELLDTENLLHEQPANRELMRQLAALYRALGQVQTAERWEKQADQPVQSEPIR